MRERYTRSAMRQEGTEEGKARDTKREERDKEGRRDVEGGKEEVNKD